jgi:hypothetical protein
LLIKGITLHSYRYAWAERARTWTCGYPERLAQEALGHNIKAVHRTYARKAQVTIPTLEDYERKLATGRGDVLNIFFPLSIPRLKLVHGCEHEQTVDCCGE